MRVAYVAQAEVDHEDGVLKKIAMQVRTWQALGHEVRLFICCRRNQIWEGLSNLPLEVFFYDGTAHSIIVFHALAAAVRQWQPQVVYHRFSKYYPGLEQIIRQHPSIIEINSDDLTEGPLTVRPAHFWYHRQTRHRILGKAAGLVFVTREISLRPHFTIFRVPNLILGNSLDLHSFPSLPAPANERPRLVFMGSSSFSWFGLDKLAYLMRQCPEWHLDLIGTTAEDFSDIPAPGISIHGRLPRTAYEQILAQADIAVDCLALHRKQMHEGSALKTREYLAYGLPIIAGHIDVDFPCPTWYICRLPNVENNVCDHLDHIREFVQGNMGTRVPRSAIAHLDARQKERERLDFMQRCLR